MYVILDRLACIMSSLENNMNGNIAVEKYFRKYYNRTTIDSCLHVSGCCMTNLV